MLDFFRESRFIWERSKLSDQIMSFLDKPILFAESGFFSRKS